MSASSPAEVYAEHGRVRDPVTDTRDPDTFPQHAETLSRRLSGEVIKGLVFRVQLPFESELCYSSSPL